MSKTFVTSDHHFGHANIINLCKRPFSSVREMDNSMIRAWNSVVGPDDLVYHLGDLAYKCSREYLEGILKRLNGRIYLVLGNHDKRARQCADRFVNADEIRALHPLNMQMIRLEKPHRVLMSHYPLASPPRGVHLHGHTHANSEPRPGVLDVGVDSVGYTPLRIEEALLLT